MKHPNFMAMKMTAESDKLSDVFTLASEYGGYIAYGLENTWIWFNLRWNLEQIKEILDPGMRVVPWGVLEPTPKPLYGHSRWTTGEYCV